MAIKKIAKALNFKNDNLSLLKYAIKEKIIDNKPNNNS